MRYPIKTTILILSSMLFAMSVRAEEKTAPHQNSWRKTLASGDYAAISKAYADYMIEHGRDVYGKVTSPLFMTVLNRKTGKPFTAPYPHVIAKPYAPGTRVNRTRSGQTPTNRICASSLRHCAKTLAPRIYQSSCVNKEYSSTKNRTLNRLSMPRSSSVKRIRTPICSRSTSALTRKTSMHGLGPMETGI